MTAAPRYDSDVRPGMLVHLRRRLWRVDDVLGDVVTATPIDDFSARPQRFARELEVIAPGTLSAPSLQSLGDNALQKLFLQAVRLDALHGTAPFVSIQRVGVIPAEYQIVPIVMALRQQPTRLLIADTTGLGKTVEAGLIIKELLARNQARSVLILTPANLREQWQQQMRDLFYLDFEIMSSDTRKRLERSIPPGADPWLYFDHLIVSMDYAKDNRIRQELLKRKWDVVVVDEAHNAAMPHLQSGRKADMDRWEAVSRIAERASKHLLLLTATPHNGYTDSYSSLLKMLSPELVTGEGADLKPNRERATMHVCQRTRTDVQRWFQEAGRSFPFPERETAADTEVAVTLDKAYINVLETLDAVLQLVASHAHLAKQQRPVEWLRLHLHRRALSSPEALRKSLENRVERLKRAKDTVPMEEETQEDETLLLCVTDQGSEDAETEEETDRRADTVMLRIDQQIQLTSFEDLVQKLRGFKPKSDRKLAKLRDEVIPALLQKADERTPAKIIVFTRYKDTLHYLERELSRQSAYEVLPIHGDMSQAMRDEQFRKLAVAERAVLLATDVISEGLNLQAISAMVVNYDLPWNPNRLEQRAGRIDRFGQPAPKVYVRTLYCKDTTDEYVMDLLIRKLETMREDLGACPPIFASDATVDRLVQRRKKKTVPVLGQLPGLFDTDAQGEADADDDDDLIRRAVERIKSDGFYGQANVRISEVSDRLKAAYERFGTPEQIHAFVEAGLRRYGCSVIDRNDGTFRIEINNPRLQVAGIPRLLESAVLNPNLRQNHSEATVLDVGHPLVRRLNAVIREDALRTATEGARTAAYVAAGQSGTTLIGHGLLRAVARTTPPTLLEEVIIWGIRSGLVDGQASLTLLKPEEAQEASERAPTGKPVEREVALRRLQNLQSNPAWEQARNQAIQEAGNNLKAYRTKIEADLASAGASAQEWLQGFDNIEIVGFDLYCLTLLLPEAR